MNLSPRTASSVVGHAEALDTRLPKVFRLLAEGRTDWRTVQLIITRTEFVDSDLMAQLDQSMAERIINWQSWSGIGSSTQWTRRCDGLDLSALLDDDGNLDHAKVVEAAQATLAAHPHWSPRKPVVKRNPASVGAGLRSGATGTDHRPGVSWAAPLNTTAGVD